MQKKLTESQQRVVDAVLEEGRSVFLTGVAGSGKTFTLKYLLDELHILYDEDELIVTGMTGIASAGLENGRTFHAALGILLGLWDVDDHLQQILRNSDLCTSIRRCKVLVIDEFSFLSVKLLNKLIYILQHVRGIFEPLAGIQFITVGDFMQLSVEHTELPLWETDSSRKTVKNPVTKKNILLPIWNHLQVHMLHEVKRQEGDVKFVTFLNRVRYGAENLIDQDKDMIARLVAPKSWPDKVIPVEIYAENAQVTEVNSAKLKLLTGTERIFEAADIIWDACEWKGSLDKSTNLVKLFTSKVGQPVIFLKNLPRHNLVNGTHGVVTDFVSKNSSLGYTMIGSWGDQVEKEYPVVKFAGHNSPVIVGLTTAEVGTVSPRIRSPASRIQLPLRAAFALTAHRAQGMTIKYLIVSVEKMTTFNQFYSAITRATSSDWLEIRGLIFNPNADFSVNRENLKKYIKHLFDAAAFYRTDETRTEGRKRQIKSLLENRPDLYNDFVANPTRGNQARRPRI